MTRIRTTSRISFALSTVIVFVILLVSSIADIIFPGSHYYSRIGSGQSKQLHLSIGSIKKVNDSEVVARDKVLYCRSQEYYCLLECLFFFGGGITIGNFKSLL